MTLEELEERIRKLEETIEKMNKTPNEYYFNIDKNGTKITPCI